MNYNEWAFHDVGPIYLQLIKKIEYAILSQKLSSEEELPSVREMAKLVHISSNTIMKAYMSLRKKGLIISSQNGLCSVIADEQYILQKRNEKVRKLCCSYLSNMIELGFSKKDATDFLVNIRQNIN